MNPQRAYLCTISTTVSDLEPIQLANQMTFLGRGDYWKRKVSYFGHRDTGCTRGWLSLIKMKYTLQPYPWYHSARKLYLLSFWSTLIFVLPSRSPSPCSALDNVFQAFPTLCSCEACPQRGEMQAVLCFARSDTRMLGLPATASRSAHILHPEI